MSTPAAPRKRRFGRIVLIQAAVLLGTVLLCEVGWRIVLAVRGKSHSAAEARSTFETSLSRSRDFVPRIGGPTVSAPDPAQGRYLHPFCAWENVGGADQITAEATRLRNPEFDGDVEILTLGGSVADMFGLFGVPRLEERLRADPRFATKRIYWYRYARGGFKQPQQLNFLTWFLGQGYTPEIVINIDGFNEAALSMDNVARGTSPQYPSIVHWGSMASGGVTDRESIDLAARGREAQKGIENLSRRATKYGLHYSALATTLTMRRLRALEAEARTAYVGYTSAMRAATGEMVLKGPPYPKEEADIATVSTRMWSESSRNIRAICDARGIFYFHALQPTLHDPGAKTMTPKEVKVGAITDTWLKGVVAAYPLMRAAGADLARGGEHFVDATGVFKDIERTIYIDSCHFIEDGNGILADRIADELLRMYPPQ